MTRGELEEVIRAQITRCVTNALQSGVPSSGIFNRAAEEILRAADAYGTRLAGVAVSLAVKRAADAVMTPARAGAGGPGSEPSGATGRDHPPGGTP